MKPGHKPADQPIRFCISVWRAAGIWGGLNEHSHCSLSVGDFQFSHLNSSQCVVYTMLVESHYVLDLWTLGWNWFLFKNQSHRKQNMTCNFNFSCTLMICRSSGVCLHAETACTGEESLWAGLWFALQEFLCSNVPRTSLFCAEICFTLTSVILWKWVSLPFLSAWLVLPTSAKQFTCPTTGKIHLHSTGLKLLCYTSHRAGKNPVPSWVNVTGRIIINLISMVQFVDTL